MAERAVKPFKDMIGRIIVGLDLDKEKWIYVIQNVLYQHNNRLHSTINMYPIDAQLAENRETVLSNIRENTI